MNTAIKNIRLASQQLSNPMTSSPKELIAWMGAMQAQDFGMAKWAIAIRLNSSTEKEIEEAFNRGDILRTHVMRLYIFKLKFTNVRREFAFNIV